MQERIIADELRHHPIFACCDRRDLRELASTGGRFSIPARWSFVHQGTPAHELYLITAGAARVYRNRVAIAELEAGDIVGEMAFFGDGQRQATVSSLERLHAVRIPYRGLAAMRHCRPELIEAISGVSAARHHTAG
jgi:NTE family protein